MNYWVLSDCRRGYGGDLDPQQASHAWAWHQQMALPSTPSLSEPKHAFIMNPHGAYKLSRYPITLLQRLIETHTLRSTRASTPAEHTASSMRSDGANWYSSPLCYHRVFRVS